MSLNKFIGQGRIPFDMELKNEDQEGKEYINFTLSVKRNYKPEGEQYYPEDLIYCKAFKAKAKFIGKYFKKGDDILVEGELRKDDDYTDKEGNPAKGQLYVLVTDTFFIGGKKESGDASEESPKKVAAKPAAALGKKPSVATPGLNPLAGGVKKKSPFK